MSTLADVAKLAGVGVGTASRALSGRGYVDDATKSKVQDAAAKLKYRRNAAARALRERRSRVVGLLIPDLSNEFYTSAAEVLQVSILCQGSRRTRVHEMRRPFRAGGRKAPIHGPGRSRPEFGRVRQASRRRSRAVAPPPPHLCS